MSPAKGQASPARSPALRPFDAASPKPLPPAGHKVVDNANWVVGSNETSKTGAVVESPQIELETLPSMRLVLFPGTKDVPGVDLGRASSGFTRVLLVPNSTAKIPAKPAPQFWTEFASQNPSPVPFRLCLNGKKSPVLKSTQLWFDFAGFVKGQIAQIGVEVLADVASPSARATSGSFGELRADTPVFKPASRLTAEAPEFVPMAYRAYDAYE